MTQKKYYTNNLTDEQNMLVERIRALLEIAKQGPYGGYGGAVSKGAAIEYACNQVVRPLEKQVENIQRKKRAEYAGTRKNNNPDIVPGVSKPRGTMYESKPPPEKVPEPVVKSRGLFHRLKKK